MGTAARRPDAADGISNGTLRTNNPNVCIPRQAAAARRIALPQCFCSPPNPQKGFPFRRREASVRQISEDHYDRMSLPSHDDETPEQRDHHL